MDPRPPSREAPAPLRVGGWPLSLRIYDHLLRGVGRLVGVMPGPPGASRPRSPSPTEVDADGSKLRRGLQGRRRDRDRLLWWAAEHRDPRRPLVWIHAPSVGEGLQARVVLEGLLQARPDLQSVYTHFSPSAEGLARGMPADAAAYLPWDARPAVESVLDALRPQLLLFTKTEVWPVLARTAGDRGIAMALVAATLPTGARRRGAMARAFLAPAFGALDRVLAISAADGARFGALGVLPGRVRVTGDPGIDSAWERAQGADPTASFLAPFHALPRPTLVAGSTWPSDEGILLPALRRARARIPELRLVVAPHEPDEGHLAPLERALRTDGWRTVRLGEVEGGGMSPGAEGTPVRGGGVDPGAALEGVDAVVVDRVGVLAHLYSAGTAAYVGGGFHGQGLHSVLEPAAMGIPVVFGPRFGNSMAAGELLREGGGTSAADRDALSRTLLHWFTEPEAARAVGARARSYLEGHRGAAARTVDALLPFLPPPREMVRPP